ncbi:protein serine/threonine phosphatase 2C [Mycena crocata]|nr:protein serine/threonine phosphatase 2C [Mycena crocata]
MSDLSGKSNLAQSSSSRIICGAHLLSFQPADVTNEDRYFVEEWTLGTGRWKMLAIFDGHGAGTEAVDFVLDTLPGMIKTAVTELAEQDISDSVLEKLLQKCIRDIDMRIQNDLVALFSDNISKLSTEDIRRAIRDPDSAEGNSRPEVLRARTGTTAIVALIDPKQYVHVASLGDCDAVVGTKVDSGWSAQILSTRHNCGNPLEVERIRAEHPGEAECVNTETHRTLGLIAVTRALGDTLFKLPAVYTERVAPLSMPPMHPNYDLKGLAARNLTPPYLSNLADVTHMALPQLTSRRLLILTSDGLFNLFSRTKNVAQLSEAAGLWSSAAASTTGTSNMAVDILWEALQPVDGENLYRSMVEGKYRGRVDDITIVVCPL